MSIINWIKKYWFFYLILYVMCIVLTIILDREINYIRLIRVCIISTFVYTFLKIGDLYLIKYISNRKNGTTNKSRIN
jgi:hypothetical protein